MMKRWYSIGVGVFVVFLLFTSGFSATYDLTGECTVSNTGHWNDCGISKEGNDSSTAIVAQRGDTVILVNFAREYTMTGTISGTAYTVPGIYCRTVDDIEYCVPLTCTLTATSNTKASGSCNWTYSGGPTCDGGWNISITKKSQSAPTYNVSGLWSYAEQSDQWTTCDEPSPGPTSGTLTVTQSGNRVTAVDNNARQYEGFVSGSKYTMVRSYLDDGGIVSVVNTITVASGGKSATGASHWIWDSGYENCDGGRSLILQKAPTITASAGAGGSISPSGAVGVPPRGNQTFIISPSPGYRVQDVRVDGVSVGAVRSYTFSDVQSDHTIEALFQTAAAMPWLQLLVGE